MSSSVNSEANKSYKLLNSLLISYNKSLPKTRLSDYISIKFKVNKRLVLFHYLKYLINNNTDNEFHRKSWSEKSWILVLETIYYKPFQML